MPQTPRRLRRLVLSGGAVETLQEEGTVSFTMLAWTSFLPIGAENRRAGLDSLTLTPAPTHSRWTALPFRVILHVLSGKRGGHLNQSDQNHQKF